jgi:hypothetical protein
MRLLWLVQARRVALSALVTVSLLALGHAVERLGGGQRIDDEGPAAAVLATDVGGAMSHRLLAVSSAMVAAPPAWQPGRLSATIRGVRLPEPSKAEPVQILRRRL